MTNLTGVIQMTQELDCSPAAAMMIERMQTHPEDFNYGGKLYHLSENGSLSNRDRKALDEAHDKYIKEPNLMVWVLETLMKPDDPKEDERMPKLTAQRMGQYDPRLLYGNAMAGGIVEYDSTTYNPATNQQRIAREIMEQHRHVEAQSRASGFFSKAFGKLI
jgi:hypothetical protein